MEVRRDHNVFLVGMPAVGKSTIGRLLSKLLQLSFFDSDQEVEARAGANIAWIFDVEGEAGFREREHQVIDELSQRSGVVLATGGGVVLSAANRRILAARGTVVLLDSSDQRICERTAKDTRRPLLKGGKGSDRAEFIARMRAERFPLYREIADLEFVTDKAAARTVARAIAAEMQQ
jgi:shikimate kinase